MSAFVLSTLLAPGATHEHRQLVVGGEVPTPFSLPYTAVLNSMGSPICTATLVHPSWVVTAAHCLGGAVIPSAISVGVHRHELNKPNEHPCAETITARSVHKHPRYNGKTIANDIGLIELVKPAACAQASSANYDPKMLALIDGMTAPTKLVASADATPTYLGVDAVVSGWGSLTPLGNAQPNTLHSATVPVLTDATSTALMQTDKEIQFCAAPLTGGTDSCFGDSGGPLVVAGATQSTLVGVVSFGSKACGTPLKPGAYTRVSAMLDFIRDVAPEVETAAPPGAARPPPPPSSPSPPPRPSGGGTTDIAALLAALQSADSAIEIVQILQPFLADLAGGGSGGSGSGGSGGGGGGAFLDLDLDALAGLKETWEEGGAAAAAENMAEVAELVEALQEAESVDEAIVLLQAFLIAGEISSGHAEQLAPLANLTLADLTALLEEERETVGWPNATDVPPAADLDLEALLSAMEGAESFQEALELLAPFMEGYEALYGEEDLPGWDLPQLEALNLAWDGCSAGAADDCASLELMVYDSVALEAPSPPPAPTSTTAGTVPLDAVFAIAAAAVAALVVLGVAAAFFVRRRRSAAAAAAAAAGAKATQYRVNGFA